MLASWAAVLGGWAAAKGGVGGRALAALSAASPARLAAAACALILPTAALLAPALPAMLPAGVAGVVELGLPAGAALLDCGRYRAPVPAGTWASPYSTTLLLGWASSKVARGSALSTVRGRRLPTPASAGNCMRTACSATLTMKLPSLKRDNTSPVTDWPTRLCSARWKAA